MLLTDGASYFVICVQLEHTRTLGIPVNFSAIVWQEHYCQDAHKLWVATEAMLCSKQPDNTEPFKIIVSTHYAKDVFSPGTIIVSEHTKAFGPMNICSGLNIN